MQIGSQACQKPGIASANGWQSWLQIGEILKLAVSEPQARENLISSIRNSQDILRFLSLRYTVWRPSRSRVLTCIACCATHRKGGLGRVSCCREATLL